MEAVRARGFAFSYPGAAAPTLGPLDWRVEEGSFTLLVGATGCGKTTLLRCLKPSLAPVGRQEGTLQVLGRAPSAFDVAGGAAEVGHVAQNPENQMVCDTVWHELAFGLENIGLPQGAMRRRVAEVAHFFGIEPWFRAAVADLSGGQQQMVNLAAVLALQPRLLVLDEPTAQLDPVAEKSFLHALFRVNRELGITVIMATHAPEATAPYATACVTLAEGRLAPSPLPPSRAERSGVEGSGSGRGTVTREAPQRQGVRSRIPRPALFARGGDIDALPVRGDRGGIPSNRDEGKDPAAPPSLVLSDVHFRYARDADWVLRGLDLEVDASGVHAVVGGNGCGKSTLLRLVAGALKPERGRVANRLASRQALLPQNPKALFVADTVLDELREWQSGCGYDDAALQAALERFSLEESAAQHPYDLSGGQQQLLAFAKILLTDPDLLLLDEPTKGLDTRSKCLLADAVRACARGGAAVVLVTHDLAFAARVADAVTMLFDGEAACTEPAGDFFSGNLFYRPVEDAFFRTWRDGAEGAASAAAPASGGASFPSSGDAAPSGRRAPEPPPSDLGDGGSR